ncbi:hypothetical protein ACI6Q2_20920 [Chitinophagaceae bacterium LWZ2-11]
MKKIFFVMCLIPAALIANGQENPNGQLINRGTVYVKESTQVEGSPFLFENWMHGIVVVDGGKMYNVSQLKFDENKNKFVYNEKDTIYELSNVASSVVLYPSYPDTSKKMIFKKGFQSNGIFSNDFVEVLAEGKITMLKQSGKNIIEYSDYGSSGKVRKYVDVKRYLILQNNKYTTVSLGKKVFETLVPDKQAEMAAFVKQNNLSGKSEEDWAKYLNYYNGLQ